jgi:hypothetical protein
MKIVINFSHVAFLIRVIREFLIDAQVCLVNMERVFFKKKLLYDTFLKLSSF